MAYALLALLFGASVGSFLNVVADRLPKGQSLLLPPSHCPACGRVLAPWELAPVLSYLALRGRCYRCHARIPLRVLAVELTLGLLAFYLWQTHGASPASLVLFVYAATLVLLAVIDLERGIILDLLVYPGLALTLVLSPWWGHLGLERGFLGSSSPAYIFLGSLAGGALAAGLFAAIILASRGTGMGWGDPKMAGLIGLVAGVPGAVVALQAAIISGGIAAVILLALRRRGRKDSMPFGPFLALGGIAALFWGEALWDWYRALW